MVPGPYDIQRNFGRDSIYRDASAGVVVLGTGQ